MTDIIALARRHKHVAPTHYEGCEVDHIGCLVNRLADEIEGLRAQLKDRYVSIRVGQLEEALDAERQTARWRRAEIDRLTRERNEARAEVEKQRAEIERLRENVDRLGKEVERADRWREEIVRVNADKGQAMTRRKTDGERLTQSIADGLAIDDDWPDAIWIAARIDRILRRRMAEAWDQGNACCFRYGELSINPYRGRTKK